ncbi:MAG: hypothetical protein IPP56_03325 [Bacteroidetes bacterium]|nr:hypothetical protein [Bacteroidota bacterium]
MKSEEKIQVALLKSLLKNKKAVIAFILSGALVSIVFSGPFFLPPLYKSEVIFYPPNTSSNKTLIQYDVRFGSEKEIDQHIQVLKSNLVRDSVIKKFNLIAHYGIDTTKTVWRFYLNKEYNEKIAIERTRYNALSVTVLDTDPVLAATIANNIVEITDAIKATILRKNLSTALSNLEKDYSNKVKEFDVFAANINRIVKDNYIPNLNLKNESFVERMKKQIDLIRELTNKGSADFDLKKQYNYEAMLAQLAELQSSYEQASSNLNTNFPTCYIISPAQVNYQKDSPNRLLIVALTTVLAGLFCIVWMLLSIQLKQVKHALES